MPTPTKHRCTPAPWYFLWIQGLLKLGDPTIMGWSFPSSSASCSSCPYIDFNPEP